MSGDGRFLASGGEDGLVRLWQVSDGHLRATWRGHVGIIHGVALSGDGQLVASAGEDGTVRLWQAGRPDQDAGRQDAAATSGVPQGPLATLRGHRGTVWAVAVSRDGGVVASGWIDGTLRLWAAPSGQLLETVQGPTSGVNAVALSRDGRFVASGGVDGAVQLWEAAGGRALSSVQAHTGTARGLALAVDGLLASGGEDGTVRLWEARSGTCLRTLRVDRRYERLDITGLSGVTEAQRTALLALGAVDRGTAPR
jgi:WD40 repeat protein